MEDYDTSPSNILSKLNNDVICQVSEQSTVTNLNIINISVTRYYNDELYRFFFFFLAQFFHATIDEICGNDKMTFQRFTNSLQWSENEYKIVRRYAFELFKDPALLYLDDERVYFRCSHR